MDPKNLPQTDALASTLEGLIDVKPEFAPGQPVSRDDGPVVAALFEGRDDPLRSLWLADLALSNSAGAALSLMPATAAEEAIAKGTVEGELFDNVSEIFNVAASVFGCPVKLTKVFSPDEEVPADVLELVGTRADYTVSFGDFPPGGLSMIVLDGKEGEALTPAPGGDSSENKEEPSLAGEGGPSEDRGESAAEDSPSAGDDPSDPRERCDLLLIDDMPHVARRFHATLPEGTTARSATNADEVRSLGQELRFKVVVVDQEMPGVDVDKLVEGLRRIQPEARFVVLTTRKVDAAALAQEKGYDGHLYKPFKRARLVQLAAASSPGGGSEAAQRGDHWVRALPLSGPRTASDQYYKALLEQVGEAVDEAADGGYEYVIVDLAQAPPSGDLQGFVPKALSACEKLGLDVRLVGGANIAQLLQRWPETARVPVFSSFDEADDEEATPPVPGTTSATAPTQQKGPDPRSLAAALRTVLLKRIASGTVALPALPETAQQAQRMLASDEPDLKAAGELLREDPVVSLQVLHVANSALYGHRSFDDVLQAVLSLGSSKVRQILYASTALQLYGADSALKGLWQHCITVANIGRELAQQQRPDEADEAFLSGLLHDIGRPTVGTYVEEAQARFARAGLATLSNKQSQEVIEAIQRVVSAAIVESWDVAERVVDAVKGCRDYDQADPKSLGNIVCFADALAAKLGNQVAGTDDAAIKDRVEQGQALLGLDDEQVAAFEAL